MKTLFLPLVVASLAAKASPESLRQEIEATYDPRIKIKSLSSSTSFFGCKLEDVEIYGQDPITSAPRKIAVSLYKTIPPSRKFVLLLPPTGGTNILDRGYANELCQGGLNVALVHSWDHQNDIGLDIEGHNKAGLRALTAVRHTLEYLAGLQPSSIGFLGTSIGAITGVLAAGYESRLSATALIVGSARFADVIAETQEQGAQVLRQKRFQEFKYKNTEEYRQDLLSKIRIDPRFYVSALKKKPVLLVTSDKDITVPTAYQNELVEALEPQVHLALRGNHTQAILASYVFHRQALTGFFLKNLP